MLIKKEDPRVKILIHKLGLKYNLSDTTIRLIVESQFLFTRDTIKQLPLKEVEEENQFNELRTNFLFRHLGKLYTDFREVKRRNDKSKLQEDTLNKRWKK